MSAQQQLSAGIIGLGVGERHIYGYESTGHCRVVALCDFDERRLAEVGARHPGKSLTTSPDEVLQDPDIDVVSVASYDEYHYRQVVAAIETGKHVFVEKPVCLFEHELKGIIEALGRHPDVKLSTNLILRRAPRFIELRRRIQAGALGRLYYIEGDYDYGRLEKLTSGWRGRCPYYSVVLGGAIHLIDLINWMIPGRAREVCGVSNKICTEDDAFRYDDFAAVLLKLDDGIIAKVTANFGSVTPHHHRLAVYGTRGTFIQTHTGAAYLYSRDPDVEPEAVEGAYPGAEKGDMIPEFVAHILDGAPPAVTATEVFENMSVAFTIERALKSHSFEEVQYMDGHYKPRSGGTIRKSELV